MAEPGDVEPAVYDIDDHHAMREHMFMTSGMSRHAYFVEDDVAASVLPIASSISVLSSTLHQIVGKAAFAMQLFEVRGLFAKNWQKRPRVSN